MRGPEIIFTAYERTSHTIVKLGKNGENNENCDMGF